MLGRLHKLRLWLRELLESPDSSGLSRGIFLALSVLILVSVLVFLGEGQPWFETYRTEIEVFEWGVMILFALELFIRLLARPEILWKPWKSPLTWVDLVVVGGYFLALPSFAFLRLLRIFRVFYLLHWIEHSSSFTAFLNSFRHYKQELRIFLQSFFLILVLGSLFFFYFEKEANPNVSNIGDAIWWNLSTISAVGYGEIVPVTIGGRLVGAALILAGLGAVALLTALITRVFIDHFFAKQRIRCEFCRFPYHDSDAAFCKNCGNQLQAGS